jgi:hypothetical protein
MGGKGGGGDNQQYYYMMQQQQAQAKAAQDAADLAAEQKRLADIAANAKQPEPEPEAPKVEEPAPEEPKPVEALGPAVGGGGFIEQPGGTPKGPLGPGSVTDTGESLGGSILNPPSYWTGKVDQYKVAPTAQKKIGSQTNTQT